MRAQAGSSYCFGCHAYGFFQPCLGMASKAAGSSAGLEARRLKGHGILALQQPAVAPPRVAAEVVAKLVWRAALVQVPPLPLQTLGQGQGAAALGNVKLPRGARKSLGQGRQLGPGRPGRALLLVHSLQLQLSALHPFLPACALWTALAAWPAAAVEHISALLR